MKLILDDFLSETEFMRLRQNALDYANGEEGMDVVDFEGMSYEGVFEQQSLEMGYKIRDHFNRGFKINAEFTRMCMEDMKNPTFIHNDISLGTHTAVLYLSEAQRIDQGTAFWRHRDTDWNRVPREKIYHKEFYETFAAEGMEEKNWINELFVPIRPNRLLVFKSDLFHSQYPYENFGNTPEDSRLVHLMFFSVSS